MCAGARWRACSCFCRIMLISARVREDLDVRWCTLLLLPIMLTLWFLLCRKFLPSRPSSKTGAPATLKMIEREVVIIPAVLSPPPPQHRVSSRASEAFDVCWCASACGCCFCRIMLNSAHMRIWMCAGACCLPIYADTMILLCRNLSPSRPSCLPKTGAPTTRKMIERELVSIALRSFFHLRLHLRRRVISIGRNVL